MVSCGIWYIWRDEIDRNCNAHSIGPHVCPIFSQAIANDRRSMMLDMIWKSVSWTIIGPGAPNSSSKIMKHREWINSSFAMFDLLLLVSSENLGKMCAWTCAISICQIGCTSRAYGLVAKEMIGESQDYATTRLLFSSLQSKDSSHRQAKMPGSFTGYRLCRRPLQH